jgi:choline-sulfatase
MTPVGRLPRPVGAGFAGALLAGGVEATGATSGGLTVLGLWVLTAPLWGLAAEALIRGAAALPDDRARRQSMVALTGLTLAVAAALLGVVVQGVVGGLKDLDLARPAMTVLALGLLSALWLLGVLASGPAARALSRLPARVGWGLAVSCLVLPSVFVLWGPFGRLAVDVSPWLLALPPVALAGATGWALAWRRRWAPHLGVAALGLGAVVLGLPGLEHDTVRQSVDDLRGLGALVSGAVQRAFDADGDGYAARFGGGDCDDADPTVNPGAGDLPGNGVDEDCDGADAAVVAVARKKVKHARRPKSLRKKLNLLLVTIDTVRADHLDLYGYGRPTAPTLRALGERGLVFGQAFTPANQTRHAMPAIMAGRAFGDLELDRVGTHLLVEAGNNLLLERLRAGGYHTIAHVSEYLRDELWYGLEAGIEDFHALPLAGPRKALSADRLTDAAIASLDGHRQAVDPRRFALWVHYLEPHEPYEAHPGSPFGADNAVDRYDGEIHAVDAQLARLLQALEDRGLRRSTVVVVTSDHGEEFGDHKKKFHGKALYQESVRVPWLINAPGLPPRWWTRR